MEVDWGHFKELDIDGRGKKRYNEMRDRRLGSVAKLKEMKLIFSYLTKEKKNERSYTLRLLPRGYGLLMPETIEILSRRLKKLLLGI